VAINLPPIIELLTYLFSYIFKVSGSNKGIGFAIVKELCAKFDGVVYLTARDESRGKQAVESLRQLGFNPRFHQLDIDDESSVIKLRDYLKDSYGGLDVLVNNAGIAFKNAATEPFSEQAVVTLQTNFFNTERICQILFPILKPHARVVNVSSSSGHLLKISGNEPAAGQLRSKLSSVELSADELRQLMRDFIEYLCLFLLCFLQLYTILFTVGPQSEAIMWNVAGLTVPTWFLK